MHRHDFLARCPACHARLALAEVCSRCGSDFSIARQAQRQSQALVCAAVQQLLNGQCSQAEATADAASALADSALARAVSRIAGLKAVHPPNAEVED